MLVILYFLVSLPTKITNKYLIYKRFMEKTKSLDTYVHSEMKEQLSYIRELYSQWTKGKKSRFLSYISREYDLKPATMVSKFTGKHKFSTLEVRVIFEAMKKGEFHEN